MSTHSSVVRALIAFVALVFAMFVHAGSSATVALGGYDVVSYRTASGPVLGTTAITTVYAAHEYRFITEENRTQFLGNPGRYLPRYDGWCATSLSMGRLVVPDYTNFKLEDGSLLLFEHDGFTNGHTLWDTDPKGFRARADQHAVDLLK
ncbi:MAG: hypothetical protein K2Y51_10625 [Gammaproteobacteria bacterium]|nr:hypothetical protein [Gammaproteobacteria bacterium]